MNTCLLRVLLYFAFSGRKWEYIIKVKENLTGLIFGELTVVEQGEDYVSQSGKEKKARWKCKCSCGNENFLAIGADLKRGRTTSCGCTSNNRKNRYIIQDNYVVMYTFKNEPFYVDLADFEKVHKICWCKNPQGYLAGNYNGKHILLHRYITDCPEGMIPDHIHGANSIHDNRRSNLRIVTPSQNNMNQKLRSDNKSGVKGVHWDKSKQKWIAKININGKQKHLGQFEHFEDAVVVRKEAEEKYFGEYSFDNSQLLGK